MVFDWLVERIRRKIEPEIEKRLREVIEKEAQQKVQLKKEELSREYEGQKGRLVSESRQQMTQFEVKVRQEFDAYKKDHLIEYESKVRLLDEKEKQLLVEFGKRTGELEKQKIGEIQEVKSQLSSEYEGKVEAKKKELKCALDDENNRLQKKYGEDAKNLELDYERRRDEMKKTLREEVVKEFKSDLEKQIRARVESELNKIYGEEIKQARRVPDLERKRRDSEERIENMSSLVERVSGVVSDLYEKSRSAEAAARLDEIEIAGNYLKRSFDTTFEILKKMESSKKRIGYVRRFFEGVEEVHKLAGEIDIDLLRTFVSSGLSVDDMRAVTLNLLSGMREWQKQWGADEYKRFVAGRIEKVTELVPEARAIYVQDEQHRDFYAGLTLEERSVLDVKKNVYLGKWEDYCADLENRMGGKVKDVEPRVVAEMQIVKSLINYEKTNSVDLSKYAA